MSRRIAVIMAGGAGQRFWPLSRRQRPKQFLSLTGQGPMLKLAVDRAAALFGLSNVYILTNQRLVEQVQELIPEAPAENIIGEPVGRNTAACLALALAHTGYDEEAPTMAVLTRSIPLFTPTSLYVLPPPTVLTIAHSISRLITSRAARALV